MLSRVGRSVLRGFADFSKDYYNELKVPKTASPADIKSAYHKLAKMWHPDSPTGNADRFKAIAEAYEVLSDAAQKKSYDTARSGGFYGGDRRSSQSHERRASQSYEEFFRQNPGYQQSNERSSSKGSRTYRYERVDPFTGKRTTYTHYENSTFDDEEFKRQQKQAEQFFKDFFSTNRSPFGDPFKSPLGNPFGSSNDSRTNEKSGRYDEEKENASYFAAVFRFSVAVFGTIFVFSVLSSIFFPEERRTYYRQMDRQQPDSLDEAVRRIKFK
jgi:curved DNA-binding protein CbpA